MGKSKKKRTRATPRSTRRKAGKLARELGRLLPQYAGRELRGDDPKLAKFKRLIGEAKAPYSPWIIHLVQLTCATHPGQWCPFHVLIFSFLSYDFDPPRMLVAQALLDLSDRPGVRIDFRQPRGQPRMPPQWRFRKPQPLPPGASP